MYYIVAIQLVMEAIVSIILGEKAWSMKCSTLRFRMDMSISIIQALSHPRRCTHPPDNTPRELSTMCHGGPRPYEMSHCDNVLPNVFLNVLPMYSPNVFLCKVPLGWVRVRQLVMGGLHPPWAG